MRLLDSPVVMVSGLSVLLSNLVSNVPAVLLFKPLMEVMREKELAWLALSMSSTLAGNLTILGSVANLIVVENARRAGTELGLWRIPQGRRAADGARRRWSASRGCHWFIIEPRSKSVTEAMIQSQIPRIASRRPEACGRWTA